MLLLDGDIIAYRCAASCEPRKAEREAGAVAEEGYVAKGRINQCIDQILLVLNGNEYRGWISGGSNFRHQIYDKYKASRRDVPVPTHLELCRDYMREKWNFELSQDIETDDEIGIAYQEGDIIVSIDKDLLQIPGKHYNFVNQEEIWVEPNDAIFNFWRQMLMGDDSDDIPGLPGIGKAKSLKLLHSIEFEDFEHDVFALYDIHNMREQFLLNKRLLTIMRTEEERAEVLQSLAAGESCLHVKTAFHNEASIC